MADIIENRARAGRELARELADYRGRDGLLVLALPRGGVPVAYEIAKALGAELDLMLVRKLGTPGQRELAMGAIASNNVRVLNDDVIEALGITPEVIDTVAREEQQELERRQRVYRGDRPYPEIRGRAVILVDDGIATGATLRAATAAIRKQSPAELVVAVPVGPPSSVRELARDADAVVCPLQPAAFMAIGQWYRDFAQVDDDAVGELLADAWAMRAEQGLR